MVDDANLQARHHTADQRGLTIGLNEFAGYVGVAIAGIVTAYMATAFGARQGLLMFGLVVIVSALVLTQFFVKETLPWAKAEGARHAAGQATGPVPHYPAGVPAHPTTWRMFTLMSWRDHRMAALCQAGLVEKFVDVSQAVSSGSRYFASQLARVSHRHLPLLARSGLRHRRPRTQYRGPQHRPDGNRILVRGAVNVRVGCPGVVAGGKKRIQG